MNYLETLKNITKSKEKKIENIILIIVLLVIILVSSKYIFSSESDDKSNEININNSKEQIEQETYNKYGHSDLEEKLSNILSEISGISDVSVMVTYSTDTKQNIAYNTKEVEKSGEKTTEKNVAYNEEGSTKNAIVETVEMPKIDGVIVVAKGANTVEIRSKIASAISALTNVAVYKIQIFEKEGGK